ncbi:hypothetical protein M436DRAFT_85660 [Aureobasidium namibiae CBS 147.97]|uniref:Uncharacterized protein n=1 Tax=Aureobasidium namibiae CBS 147.97 TaxID=1043004 RepID=A0A074W8Z7_9PEZI
MTEDVDEAAVDIGVVSDVETSTAEVENDTIVEFETVSDIDTNATAEDEDNVLVEFEPVGTTDAEVMTEDDDKLILELEAVFDAEEDPEAVPMMAFARRLPSIELLELDMEFILEELTGPLDNKDELERILLDDADVELPMLLEDDAELERTLLIELGVGDADRLFEVELNRVEVEDGEAEELPTVLLLLLILVELLLDLIELLLDLRELLLFLLDVLVLLLVLILVSEALNELDVVEVTFLVTFLLASR